ncbi:MAG: polysaccharide deacetylase family protein, partial [Clostridium sp.]
MHKRLIISLTLLLCLSLTSCSKAPSASSGESLSKEPTKEHSKNTPNPKTTDNTQYNPEELTKPTSINPSPKSIETSLSNKEIHWGFRPNKEHKTPEILPSINELLSKHSSFYTGDTTSKKLYLTFDEGYENGYTGQILDILKANNVPAAFFVTRPYIKKESDLINRMVNEGHIVGNHTSTHPAMPSITDNSDRFAKEFSDTEEAFKDITGKDMPKFFRPPMGRYSEKSLYMTSRLGYKSIFWSFAHKDWEVDNQPSTEHTIQKIKGGMHNGCIILLHAVSESNT